MTIIARGILLLYQSLSIEYATENFHPIRLQSLRKRQKTVVGKLHQIEMNC